MRRKRSSTHSAARTPRPSRRIEAAEGEKPTAATACPRCGASYRDGRWSWEAAADGSRERICPACERIDEDYPAGLLRVEGDFTRAHRDELIALLRNVEERERTEHPLKRIMQITDDARGIAVTVTDRKLVDALGRALKRSYQGQLDLPRSSPDKENLARARWARD